MFQPHVHFEYFSNSEISLHSKPLKVIWVQERTGHTRDYLQSVLGDDPL